MPQFTYTAKRDDGRTVTGIVEAACEKAAQNLVEEKGLVLLSLNEYKISFFARPFSILKPVKRDEMVAFSRELAVMVGSNIPLVQALNILQKQTANKHLKIVSSSLADDVNGGARLSQAMAKHKEVFSKFFISMVYAGEESGKLDEVLEYLADEQERDYETTQKIRGAMIYPLFVVGGLIAIGILMSVFVLPRMLQIVSETVTAGVILPLPTRILIFITNFLQNAWPYISFVLVLFVVLSAVAGRTQMGRTFISRIILRIPIFGDLIGKVILVRFSQSLSTLLKGGVPLTQALGITADVVGNEVYSRILLESVKEVEDGRPLTSVFAKKKIVPSMVVEMLTVGETSGSINDVLDELSTFYRREVEDGIESLVRIIEPVIIVVLGLGVGMMVAAVLLPLYSTITQL